MGFSEHDGTEVLSGSDAKWLILLVVTKMSVYNYCTHFHRIRIIGTISWVSQKSPGLGLGQGAATIRVFDTRPMVSDFGPQIPALHLTTSSMMSMYLPAPSIFNSHLIFGIQIHQRKRKQATKTSQSNVK